MREHIKADEPFERDDVSGRARRSSASRAEGQDYKVELIEDLVRDRRRRDRLALPQRPVHRPLPRPARPRTKRIKAFKLTSRRRRLLARRRRAARCSRASTARRSSRRRTSRSTSSGSRRRARATTASSAASSSCSRFSEVVTGLALLAARAARRSATSSSRSTGAMQHASAATTRCKTPLLYDVEPLGDLRPLGQVPREHVRHRRRGPRVRPQADELSRRTRSCSALQRWSYRDLPYPLRRAGPRCTATSPAARCTASCACATSPRTTRTSSAPRSRSRTRSLALPRLRLRRLRACSASESTLELSTRPEKRLGTDEMWDRAEGALAEALESQRPRVRRSTRATAPSTGRRSTCT